MKAPVLTKADYYRRWIAGEFGNRPQVWNSFTDLDQSGYKGFVNIRHRQPGSPYFGYALTRTTALDWIKATGVPVAEFSFNETMPDDRLLIQGELMEDHRGLCLAYSREPTTMRNAMRNPKQVYGLTARQLLKYYCDPYSYDWLLELLTEFPGHVVEWSTYSVLFGTERKNTAIWEVRKY
jgi:hypothetical protein